MMRELYEFKFEIADVVCTIKSMKSVKFFYTCYSWVCQYNGQYVNQSKFKSIFFKRKWDEKWYTHNAEDYHSAKCNNIVNDEAQHPGCFFLYFFRKSNNNIEIIFWCLSIFNIKTCFRSARHHKWHSTSLTSFIFAIYLLNSSPIRQTDLQHIHLLAYFIDAVEPSKRYKYNDLEQYFYDSKKKGTYRFSMLAVVGPSVRIAQFENNE